MKPTLTYHGLGNLTDPITQTKDPNPKNDPTVLYSGWARPDLARVLSGPDRARVLSEPDQIFLIF